MRVVRALLQDADNCASVPFGEESVLCVLSHPEQYKGERVGYYVVLQEAGRWVLKAVIEEYGTLVLYLQHAGISLEEGWTPAGERRAQQVRAAVFSLSAAGQFT